MTTQLRLAGNVVPNTSFGHFQIVYFVSEQQQYEIEVQPSGNGFGGYWMYPEGGQPRDHIKATSEYFHQPSKYKSTPILEGGSADNVWDILEQVHKQFDAALKAGHEIPYVAQSQNSNSYAATALSVVGIDINRYADAATPTDVTGAFGVDKFPGQGMNILDNPFLAISLNLHGSIENDTIRTGVKNDTLRGLTGNDTLIGGGGIDTLDRGAGNDTLSGGPDADVFILSSGNDVITDFAGSTRLINFEFGPAAFGSDAWLVIPNGYDGLTWNNFGAVDAARFGPPGFQSVLHSGIAAGFTGNAEGGYSTPDDFVRTVLRERREQKARRQIDDALLASLKTPSEGVTPAYVASLRSEAQTIIEIKAAQMPARLGFKR